MKRILFVMVVLAVLSGRAFAANSLAKHDGNGVPTLIGVASGTNAIRNIRVTDDGILYIAASASLPVSVTLSPDYITTFDYATASVSASATGTFTLPVTAASVLLVNESSTQTIRFCIGCTLDVTCALSSGGIQLVAGASVGMDGLSISAVKYCNGAGAPASVSIQTGRKP